MKKIDSADFWLVLCSEVDKDTIKKLCDTFKISPENDKNIKAIGVGLTYWGD